SQIELATARCPHCIEAHASGNDHFQQPGRQSLHFARGESKAIVMAWGGLGRCEEVWAADRRSTPLRLGDGKRAARRPASSGCGALSCSPSTQTSLRGDQNYRLTTSTEHLA